MSIFDDLREAIANRLPVLLLTKLGRRYGLPHRIYRQPDGTFLLEFFQLRGVSAWMMRHGWKFIRLEDIRGLTKGRGPFKPAPGWNPNPAVAPGRPVAQIIEAPGLPGRRYDNIGQTFFPFLSDVLGPRPYEQLFLPFPEPGERPWPFEQLLLPFPERHEQLLLPFPDPEEGFLKGDEYLFQFMRR